MTLKQIVKKTNVLINKQVSISTIDRCLKKFHFTLKNIVLSPEKRNDPITIDKRHPYAENLITRLGKLWPAGQVRPA